MWADIKSKEKVICTRCGKTKKGFNCTLLSSDLEKYTGTLCVSFCSSCLKKENKSISGEKCMVFDCVEDYQKYRMIERL